MDPVGDASGDRWHGQRSGHRHIGILACLCQSWPPSLSKVRRDASLRNDSFALVEVSPRFWVAGCRAKAQHAGTEAE